MDNCTLQLKLLLYQFCSVHVVLRPEVLQTNVKSVEDIFFNKLERKLSLCRLQVGCVEGLKLHFLYGGEELDAVDVGVSIQKHVYLLPFVGEEIYLQVTSYAL